MISLREAMDRLFDDAFTHPLGLANSDSLPSVDVYETRDEVVVKAALPGIKPEDVQISVTGDVLSMHGEFKQEEEKKDASYHLREMRKGVVDRSIRLPVDVQTDKAKADFENGVLTITLPKADKVKPKTITIQTK
jgi:HSP20 family protein